MPLRPRSPQSKGRDSRRDTCYPAAPAHSDSRRGTLRTGQQRQSEAISDHQPDSQERTGQQRQSEAISDHQPDRQERTGQQRQSEAISDHQPDSRERTGQQRQSEAISDHQPDSRERTGQQRQSEAIGCTQMRSEAMGDDGLYPEPLELYKWGGQSACMQVGRAISMHASAPA